MRSGNSLIQIFLLVILVIPLQSQVTAKHGMVSSSSLVASEVGRDILKNGGNAIDASVAAAFALAVTWPSAGNIGGGGFLVYRDSKGKATTIDFREKAPLAASEKMFLNDDRTIYNNSNHQGILSVGVPGTVAGLYDAHKKYGSLEWKEVVQPAVDLALNGFPFTETLYAHAEVFKEKYKDIYPGMATYLLSEAGTLISPGELWKQPELGQALIRIRDEGHNGFYSGKTAALLVEYMDANGGLITMADLEKYRAIERTPIRSNYRGYDLISMGPPSSGGVILMLMLNMLEHFDLEKIQGEPAYYHLLAEVMRRGYADRARYLGDPDFNSDMPVDKLLSKAYARELAETIDPHKAGISDSSSFNRIYEGDNTTHLSVMDKDGNAVSLTYTLEYSYGSKLVVDSLGFILNNEMGDFNPVAGLTNSKGLIGTPANLIRPEKRMLSSMTPTIVAADGVPFLIIGSPGGRTIINSVLQTIINVVDFKMDVQAAIEAGKIHHQWLPDRIVFEEGAFDKETMIALEKMGHVLYPVKNIGSLMGIRYHQEIQLMEGGADSSSGDGGVAGF